VFFLAFFGSCTAERLAVQLLANFFIVFFGFFLAFFGSCTAERLAVQLLANFLTRYEVQNT